MTAIKELHRMLDERGVEYRVRGGRMSITDELREYANGFKNSHDAWSGIGDDLTTIADRIDAEYERVRAESIIDMTDESMAAHGWVRLPKDADGVPIRVGDKIEYLSGGRDIVRFVTLNHNGWLVNERGWEPYTMRHYHVPTVEDVLREFADEVQRCCDTADTIAEYAKRLTLAEEVDG